MNNYTKYWRDIKTNIKDSRGVQYLLHGVSPRLPGVDKGHIKY